MRLVLHVLSASVEEPAAETAEAEVPAPVAPAE